MHYALHACPECGERCYCKSGEDDPKQCSHICPDEADAEEHDFSADEAQYNYED